MATGLLGVLIGALGTLLPAQTAIAATGINKTINFQGKVVNANGTNVTNGNYPFNFKIYTASSGGSSIWTENKTLTVTDGVFQTNLGDATALPGSVDFNTDNIYLGITFNNDGAGEMSPRIQFTAAAYAFNSDTLDGLDSGAFAQLAANNTFTGANLFNPSASGIALTVRAYSGGGQRSLEIRDSANAVKGYFDAAGSLNVGATLQPTADNTVDLGSGSLQFKTGYFGTSVITPKVASGSGNLVLDSASNIIALDATETTLQRTTTGTNTTYTVDLKDSAATTFTVTNSGTGAASLSVEAGISAGTTVSAATNFVANSQTGQGATCAAGEARTGAVYTGGILTTAGTCISVQAAGNYLVRVPTATADNTVTPATSGVVGVTINATNTGTAAQALIVNQSLAGAATAEVNSTNTTGTQTNGLLINRNGTGGTTTNGLNITQTAGTLTNGLAFTGTISKDIKLQNSETIDNATDGTINLQADSGVLTLKLTGTAATVTNSAGNLTLDSFSNTLGIAASDTTLQRTAAGTR